QGRKIQTESGRQACAGDPEKVPTRYRHRKPPLLVDADYSLRCQRRNAIIKRCLYCPTLVLLIRLVNRFYYWHSLRKNDDLFTGRKPLDSDAANFAVATFCPAVYHFVHSRKQHR